MTGPSQESTSATTDGSVFVGDVHFHHKLAFSNSFTSYIQSTHTQTLIHTYICAHISINKSKQIHLTPVHPQRACSSSLCICPCPVTSLAPLLTHILNPVAHPLHVQTSFTCCCNKQACKKSSGFVCNSLFLLCHPRMGSSVKNSAHNQLGSILFFFSSG